MIWQIVIGAGLIVMVIGIAFVIAAAINGLNNMRIEGDYVTYSTDEVFARLEKIIRISRKYYKRNTRRGNKFRFEHPVSKRRGQKFLDKLTPGLPDMINDKIKRQKPGKVIEQKPARSSGARASRKYRRKYF